MAKSNPIPADLLAMSIEQLQDESASYDNGALRGVLRRLASMRDEAQNDLSRHAQRRLDINRALMEKYSARVTGKDGQ